MKTIIAPEIHEYKNRKCTTANAPFTNSFEYFLNGDEFAQTITLKLNIANVEQTNSFCISDSLNWSSQVHRRSRDSAHDISMLYQLFIFQLCKLIYRAHKNFFVWIKTSQCWSSSSSFVLQFQPLERIDSQVQTRNTSRRLHHRFHSQSQSHWIDKSEKCWRNDATDSRWGSLTRNRSSRSRWSQLDLNVWFSVTVS